MACELLLQCYNPSQKWKVDFVQSSRAFAKFLVLEWKTGHYAIPKKF